MFVYFHDIRSKYTGGCWSANSPALKKQRPKGQLLVDSSVEYKNK